MKSSTLINVIGFIALVPIAWFTTSMMAESDQNRSAVRAAFAVVEENGVEADATLEDVVVATLESAAEVRGRDPEDVVRAAMLSVVDDQTIQSRNNNFPLPSNCTIIVERGGHVEVERDAECLREARDHLPDDADEIRRARDARLSR